MNRRLRTPLRLTWLLLGLACLLALLLPSGSSDAAGGDLPNVLVVTVDTLRTDRLSAYGYRRPTSPNLDRLLQGGARLTQARTVEPLTNPALSSMLTSLYPHEHGGTRNGLKMRLGLDSLPKTLAGRGWQTAAFVGNWTLRHQLSGLGEHFDSYEEVLTKRRWFGLFKGEADADDVTAAAIEWLDAYGGRRRPFFLWVHYVDPHAPYVFHEDFAERLGIRGDDPSKSDRYDTEVAFVDYHAGRLLDRVAGDARLRDRTAIVFASDHGESLGEHGYWGHGRNLHEPNLHIPMGFAWPGRIAPRVIEAPAVLIDVAPTVLGLLGLEPPEHFRGFDWSGVLRGGEPPRDRATWFQAHRGAVVTAREAKIARPNGLLEVGLVSGGMKEIVAIGSDQARLFDLARDPSERKNLRNGDGNPSEDLAAWLETVEEGLRKTGSFPPPVLDPEAIEQLKALGYAD